MRVLQLLLAGAVTFCRPALARSQSVLVVPGQRLSLRLPPAAFRADTGSSADSNLRIADLARSGDAITVNGNRDWRGIALAPASTTLVVDVTGDRRARKLIIRLRSKWPVDWRLTIPFADTAFVVPRLFEAAADSSAVAATIREDVRQRLFRGAMAAVSPAGQTKILDVVASRLHGDTVRTVDVDGRPYLIFRAIESTYTCTIGETTDAGREAQALAEVAFPDLWNLGRADSTLSGAFGFAIRVQMKLNYSCVTEGSRDFVTIYAPGDATRLYAAGAITGRELMARSIEMFNGKPVKLELAKQL